MENQLTQLNMKFLFMTWEGVDLTTLIGVEGLLDITDN